MAKKQKYNYFLATVCENGRLQYVTKIETYPHKYFYRDAGEPATALSKTVAEDVHLGMILNMYTAVIVQLPTYMGAPYHPPKDYTEGEPYKVWG